MTQRILSLFAEGQTDAAIAAQLTSEGFRSPMGVRAYCPARFRPSACATAACNSVTVPSPAYRWSLTVPQLAKALAVSRYWLYDRIHNGVIGIRPDPATGLYLFPDELSTLVQLRQLRDGTLNKLPF